ncbi:TolB family protein [Flavilitoribacter nigricans]|uniref:Peptidase S9 n=1 Tax=Flavilitoribacter nigricans (strain ATCC 23147 / DSM 23189 / NBRC 102662 / NCIMB 1420 / SS-2) TaxID=1122177 RepID=A0A2D0N706_FLAN2|nr:PD40 domain-containing protein [Flavilitoribacter nigricans]PHN04284.1 hypothetical protein CRP01_22235 [Flavilitoribacter nigricans DSM 23189 = NBRC 102662]
MRIFILFLLGLWGVSLHAQIPANTIGANPFGLKWQQINTDKVQVIFPEGNDIRAQRVANVAHYLWDHNNASIGDKMKKVTILLQNQTVVPNGFVTVGPFRSEFYLTPTPFNMATDWLDQLAIHEFRHVKQFGNSRRGLTSLARSIFGSWAWGGFTATALPRWFFEGDATVQETALTLSGRGRQPAFTMEQRALILDGIDYGYEKAAAGSLKDFVPNWYSLGYYMVGYGRTRFGEELWSGVVNDAVRYKGLFFPLSKSLKKRTGLGTREFYQAMRQDLESKWKSGAPGARALEESPIVNRFRKKTVVNYTNPRWLDDADLVVEKRGYDQLPMYYRLRPDGVEQKLTNSGVLLSAPESTLSQGNGRLVWAEYGFDLRRSNQTYSVIRTYDISTGSKRQLTSQSKYFSPAITERGDRIVAVEVTPNGTCSLVVIDPAGGEVIRQIPNPDVYFFQFPRWTSDGSAIVVIGQRNERQALYRIDPATGRMEAITPATPRQLNHPEVRGDNVYFAAGYTGVNQIYTVPLGGGAIRQITEDPIGAFQPAVSPNGRMLAYSAFRTNGFDILKEELDESTWRTVDVNAPEDRLPTYAEELARQEGGTIVPTVPDEKFPVRKFNKTSGLINVHSWLPQLDPPEVGASILSDNKFGTLSIDAGAYYNLNEEEWTFSSNLRYAELFPIITLGYSYQNRAARLINYRAESDSIVRFASYVEEWTENKLTAGVELPFNFSKGNAVHRLDLIARFDRFHVNPQGNVDNPDRGIDTLINVGPNNTPRFRDLYLEPLAETDLNAIDLRLRWRLFRRQAVQHLTPHWGIVTDTRYRATVGNDLFSGFNFVTRGDIYLPAFFPSHGFYLNAGYQKLDRLDNYRFSNFFIYPRGYGAIGADDIVRLSANYTLPLAYPDLAIGPLAFVKRIKLNGFIDYGQLNFENDIFSYGAELRFDVRFLRLLEVDFGVRYSYLRDAPYAPNGNQHQFDFLLISITE